MQFGEVVKQVYLFLLLIRAQFAVFCHCDICIFIANKQNKIR